MQVEECRWKYETGLGEVIIYSACAESGRRKTTCDEAERIGSRLTHPTDKNDVCSSLIFICGDAKAVLQHLDALQSAGPLKGAA